MEISFLRLNGRWQENISICRDDSLEGVDRRFSGIYSAFGSLLMPLELFIASSVVLNDSLSVVEEYKLFD